MQLVLGQTKQQVLPGSGHPQPESEQTQAAASSHSFLQNHCGHGNGLGPLLHPHSRLVGYNAESKYKGGLPTLF